MIVSHAPELADGDRHREIMTRLFGTVSFGALAVDGFFLISGFLITKSWVGRPEIVEFLVKRSVRILPGFVAATLASVFLVGRIAEIGHPSTGALVASAAKSLARLAQPEYPVPLGFPHHDSLNGSMWTIRWEFACYLLAGFGGLAGLTRRRWTWLAMAGLSLALVAFQDRHGIDESTHLPDVMVRFVAMFATGALFYLYRERVAYRPAAMALAGIGLAAGLSFAPTAQAAIAVLGGYLLFGFAFTKIPRLAPIGTRNDLSYGIYLYAYPIQQLLLRYGPGMPLAAHMLVALALSCGMGLLSWHLVESPALRLRGVLASARRRSLQGAA